MFEVIDLYDANSWDNIVDAFPDSTVYDSREYLSSLQSYTKSRMKLFFYDDDVSKLFYVMQINDIAGSEHFCNVLPENQYYDMETPYGYGGLRAINYREIAAKALVDNVAEYCRGEGIVSQFIRFTPYAGNYIYSNNISELIRQKATIGMKLTANEQIVNDLDSKNRNMIRKAQKNGLTVDIVGKDEEKDMHRLFIDMYRRTMDRNNAQSFYYFDDLFFSRFFSDMSDKHEMFYVKYNGNIASMAIILKDKTTLHYHLSAANREYMQFAPNNLLLYSVALWGLERGYKFFHLGGGVTDNDSLFRFKKAFCKNKTYDYYIGSNIFIQDKYDYLVGLRQRDGNFDIEKKFLIKYRQD